MAQGRALGGLRDGSTPWTATSSVRTRRRRSDGARPRAPLDQAYHEVSAGEAHANMVLEAIIRECCLEANAAAAAAAVAAATAAAVDSMRTRLWS